MSLPHTVEPAATVADESTRLLDDGQLDGETHIADDASVGVGLDASLSASVDNNDTPKTRESTRVFALVCILLLLLDIAGFLQAAPQTKIFEEIICQRYYTNLVNNTHGDTLPFSVDEPCKVEPVQSELAVMQGYKDFFEQLPGMVFGVAYGLLADRIGRRPVLFLGMFGLFVSGLWVKAVCWFSFPIQMVYLSAPILIIGGGAQVASSMFYIMLADSYSAEKRATSFSYFSAVVLTAEMTATPISGAIMMADPWIPYLGSSGIELLAFLVACLFTRETLRQPTGAPAVDLSRPASARKERSFGRLLMNRLKEKWNMAKESTLFVRSSLNVTLLVLVFFVATLSRNAMTLLLQYATKKYHWSYSQAAFLIALRGAINLAAVLVLPVISRLLLTNAKLDAAAKDLWLSRGTALLLTLGTLMMFLAPTPAVLIVGIAAYALGSPLYIAARSLVTFLVLPNQIGVLYTFLATIQSLGMLVAGPLLAYVFRWGMQLGDPWLGLPFLAASVMYLAVLLLICAVNLSRIPPVTPFQVIDNEVNGRNHHA